MFLSAILDEKLKIKLNTLIKLLVFLFLAFVASYITLKYLEFDPNLDFENTSSKVYDVNGLLLWEISENNSVRRTPISLSEVPQACINAIVSVEDKSFWSNIGVDERGLVRLTLSIFSGGRFGGGSTISQQLIKNANDRIVQRDLTDKLTEIIQAVKLNSVLSKEEILESYLNNIYFGNLNYGIEAAANEYFAKKTRELSTLECAYLMGVPQNPGIYNPSANIALGIERKNRVLSEMYKSGYLSEDELNELEDQTLNFAQNNSVIRAPHFIEFLKSELQKNTGSDLIYSDQTFSTNYDYILHTSVLNIVQEQVNNSDNINNASVIILDSEGALKTMIGSANFFDDEISGKFNSSLGLRQPTMMYAPLYLDFLESSNYDLNQEYANFPFVYARTIRDANISTAGRADRNNPLSQDFLSLNLALQLREPIPLTNSIDTNLVEQFLNSSLFKEIFSTEEINSLLKRCDKYLLFEGCEISLFDLSKIYWNYLTSRSLPTNLQMILSNDSGEKFRNERFQKLIDYESVDINFKDFFAVQTNQKYLILVWAGNTDGTPFSANIDNVARLILTEVMNYVSSN